MILSEKKIKRILARMNWTVNPEIRVFERSLVVSHFGARYFSYPILVVFGLQERWLQLDPRLLEASGDPNGYAAGEIVFSKEIMEYRVSSWTDHIDPELWEA